MKILVADDSKTTLSLISNSLEKLGHEVIVASTGQQAVDMFQINHPELIILDVIMEGIDGFECAKRIRAINPDDWIPIIFLSGAVDDENIAKGINVGGDDYLTKPFNEITLSAKIKAMQRIAEMRKKLFETTKNLSHLSAIDSLTGIYNRFQFDRSIKEKIAHAEHYQRNMAVLFLDLDNFKSINDGLGHNVGDLILIEFPKVLKSCLRLDDFIARIGGDEFAIILCDYENKQALEGIAKKIIQSMEKPYLFNGNEIYFTTSIGIACYPEAGSDPAILVKNADIAMYHAKNLGRNTFQFYTNELNHIHNKKIFLENSLKFAVEKNQLFLNYQPIFSLKTKKIVKLEALLNWNNPEIGLIPPDIFIPIAEEYGMIETIGEWVLKTVCEQGEKWQKSNHKDIKLSVNISPQQLLQKNISKVISDILKKTSFKPESLELELTETSAVILSEFFKENIKQICELGISISLDDFGTGFSSLSHIKHITINTIKIDKSFIKNLTDSKSDSTIVKSIIGLANNLGITVVAEGIENEAQLKFLTENGCNEGQGYYLSNPKNANEITAYLEEIDAATLT